MTLKEANDLIESGFKQGYLKAQKEFLDKVDNWINAYFSQAMKDENCQVIWCFQLQELKQSLEVKDK